MQVLEDSLYLENIQEYVHDEDKIVSYSLLLFIQPAAIMDKQTLELVDECTVVNLPVATV